MVVPQILNLWFNTLFFNRLSVQFADESALVQDLGFCLMQSNC
jgi:hypothetical protein